MQRRRTVAYLGAAGIAAAVGAAASVPASAAATASSLSMPARSIHRAASVTTIATFDHAANETPENLVVLRDRVVVSLAFASTVVSVDGSGRRLQSVHLDTAGGFIAGLALDHRRRTLAVAVSSPSADVAGLYELPLSRGVLGTPRRLAALPAGAFPNGLAFDPAGDLYAADSLLGTIWRAAAHAAPGAPAQAWLRDTRLAPDGGGLPGANGIKYRHGRLYVSNTSRSTLLSVPLHGRRELTLVRDDLRIDDFTFGLDGTLYAALNQANEVVRGPLEPRRGPVNVLLDQAQGAHNPSAVALVGGPSPRLYVTNAAFDGPTPSPSLQLITLVRHS